nr:uncharacterized protein CTRU02_09942 [Colletotrichum truncatum]KAF6787647.1 hypothetical protein CTRU02_09942 [Colletotrichum truncatum]
MSCVRTKTSRASTRARLRNRRASPSRLPWST